MPKPPYGSPNSLFIALASHPAARHSLKEIPTRFLVARLVVPPVPVVAVARQQAAELDFRSHSLGFLFPASRGAAEPASRAVGHCFLNKILAAAAVASRLDRTLWT